MNTKKGLLQRSSLVLSVLSVVLAVVSFIFFWLRLESLGIGHPVTASFMATTVFFISVGVILYVMAKADIPSFKFDDTDEKLKE